MNLRHIETQIDLENTSENQNQQKKNYSSGSQRGHSYLKVWYISITQELVRCLDPQALPQI